jgi:hypothetical protein
MSEVEVSLRHLSLIKPTLDTPFHIDHNWWEGAKQDFRVELRSHLCTEHREIYAGNFDTEVIDWVDDQTGEVRQVDGLQYVIREHCSHQPGYFGDEVSLIDSVFRVFLTNSNRPLTCRELSDAVGRPAELILRTLSGRRIYKGLRPMPKNR